jgi:hypothetical protein
LHFPKCHKKCWWILLLLLALNCFLRSRAIATRVKFQFWLKAKCHVWLNLNLK